MTDDAPVAGWYPDPLDVALLRYWDGHHWTENVAPVEAQVDPLPVAGRSPLWRLLGIAAATITAILLLAFGAWSLIGIGDETAQSPPISTRSPSSNRSTPPTTVAPVTSIPATSSPTTSTTVPPPTTLRTTSCSDIVRPLAPVRFSDIDGMNDEATTAIRWAQTVRLVSISVETFRPLEPITRAELAIVMWHYFCSPDPGGSAGFADVPNGAFFAAAANWAVNSEIIAGTEPGTFAPLESVSRAQFVTMVWRSVGSPRGSQQAPFDDTPTGSFYSEALDWAFDVGLVNGRTSTRFAPGDPIDRITAIVLFWRLEMFVDPFGE